MAEFKTFRDAEASLWQSAVAHAISQAEPAAAAGTSQPAHPDHPLARAAERAGTLITHVKPLFASLTTLPASLPDALAAAGGLEPSTLGAVAAAEAPRFATEAAFVEALRLKFGNLDPQWLEALRNYHRYLQNNRADVPYRKHTNLGDFVIEGKLPAQAKVAIVADWGTGTSEAIALLQKLAAQEPDVLIHLGDIYYSGQQDEVDQRFKNPCRKVFAGKRTAIFTLAGNHDMYSGGLPYYRLLDDLGQPASYFCLRNDHWQFLAMDTGLNSDVGDNVPTRLEETELTWARDKTDNAGGRRTILLSHHQLFSAYEAIGGQFMNTALQEQWAPILPADTVWYWGHEHDLVVFKPFAQFRGLRGRCIGHGAIPVPFRFGDALVPRRRIDNNLLPVDESVRLARNGFYYNNGYLVIELDGPAATETYYQYPVAGELLRRAL